MQGVAERTCIPLVPDTIQAKTDIRTYPKITRNLSKWKVDRDQFIAIAMSQKILSLLLVQYKPPTGPDELRKHQEANRFLFSALLHATAEGTEAIKIKKFQANQNGRLAWLALRSYAEGQGSKDTIAHATAHDIQYLMLTQDSVGGAEAYTSKFGEALLKLEETGYPYHEGLKKINFLNGIEDEEYKPLVDICREDASYDYQQCVLSLRRKAVEVEKKKTKSSQRYVAAIVDNQVQQELHHLPTELWDIMTEDQKSM